MFDCVPQANRPIYNFFAESLYFDGLSPLFGYRRVETLSIHDPWTGYKRTALTILKIFLYASFPVLTVFSLAGKVVCYYLEPSKEATENNSQITTNQKRSTNQEKQKENNLHIYEKTWFEPYHINDYCLYLRDKYGSKVFFPLGYKYTVEYFSKGLFFSRKRTNRDLHQDSIKDFFQFKAIIYPLFIPLGGDHLDKGHWTLLYIDRVKRTVEYYDSMVNYGNHNKIIKVLKNLAQEFTRHDEKGPQYVFSKKISKKLQQDGYQCGPWILYFLENRLQNPDVDFNKLDINKAQTMIAEYRSKVRDKLLELKENGREFMLSI